MRISWKAKVQKGLRIQVPRNIRAYYKLKTGSLYKIQFYNGITIEEWIGKLSSDGRFKIPLIIAERMKIKPRQTLSVTLET